VADGRRRSFLDWGVAARPLDGEAECGDRALVVVTDDVALVAAIDGLGHGREAARAADRAVETLRAVTDEPLVEIAGRCHEALRQTRGAALSLARVCARDDTVTWLGVGNVEGRLVHGNGSGALTVESLIPTRGIAGGDVHRLNDTTLPLRRGDVVLLATDGIKAGFADSLRTHGSADELAARILADHSKVHDDALVVAARYIGADR
jgi:negative regulator of sigma-B (phosphoserine phosphatase)